MSEFIHLEQYNDVLDLINKLISYLPISALINLKII